MLKSKDTEQNQNIKLNETTNNTESQILTFKKRIPGIIE